MYSTIHSFTLRYRNCIGYNGHTSLDYIREWRKYNDLVGEDMGDDTINMGTYNYEFSNAELEKGLSAIPNVEFDMFLMLIDIC